MKKPTRFYEAVSWDRSYQVWELQHILKVSRSTIYRLLKRCAIPRCSAGFGHRKTKHILFIALLPIVQTPCFKKYIRRLKESEEKDIEDTQYVEGQVYNDLPESKLHVLYRTPRQLTQGLKMLCLTNEETEWAVYAGLIPTIKINNNIYVTPWYVDAIGVLEENNEQI